MQVSKVCAESRVTCRKVCMGWVCVRSVNVNTAQDLRFVRCDCFNMEQFGRQMVGIWHFKINRQPPHHVPLPPTRQRDDRSTGDKRCQLSLLPTPPSQSLIYTALWLTPFSAMWLSCLWLSSPTTPHLTSTTRHDTTDKPVSPQSSPPNGPTQRGRNTLLAFGLHTAA